MTPSLHKSTIETIMSEFDEKFCTEDGYVLDAIEEPHEARFLRDWINEKLHRIADEEIARLEGMKKEIEEGTLLEGSSKHDLTLQDIGYNQAITDSIKHWKEVKKKL